MSQFPRLVAGHIRIKCTSTTLTSNTYFQSLTVRYVSKLPSVASIFRVEHRIHTRTYTSVTITRATCGVFLMMLAKYFVKIQGLRLTPNVGVHFASYGVGLHVWIKELELLCYFLTFSWEQQHTKRTKEQIPYFLYTKYNSHCFCTEPISVQTNTP